MPFRIMEELKKMAAERAVRYIKDGMAIGLGTGSTTRYAIEEIGKLVKEGIKIIGIPTSIKTEKIASRFGISISELDDQIDLTIDGADEVDAKLNLIKGKGGALLREKMVARNSKREIIIVDESKMATILSLPLPIEIAKFGWRATKRRIEELGGKANLRKDKNAPFITDNGNYIIDCDFGEISEPKKLSEKINLIPGVVENGLFINMADEVIIGTRKGIKIKKKKKSKKY
jgi:ribose 5-phosphate isomerase A